MSLDRTIISSRCFEAVLQQDYALPSDGNAQALVAGNRVLYDEFNSWINDAFQALETGLADSAETLPRTKVTSGLA